MSTCVVVTGVGGSGTSATAGCLHKMGVHMGDHLATHPAGFCLYEDTCLYGAFSLPARKMRTALVNYALVHERDLWGFKSTLAWKSFSFLPELYAKLGHDVKIVVAHRTFMASVRARKEGRCPPGKTFSMDAAVQWALEATNAMTLEVRLADCPVLHVSYEDLVASPAKIVGEMAQFVGVEPTADALAHVRRE